MILLLLLGAAILAGEIPAAWAQEEIHVTNFNANSVTVYERMASGAIAPTRIIQGPATKMNRPVGVVVDTVHDELVVGNTNGGGITVFARTASGNAAPHGVAIDFAHDELIVTNQGNHSVQVHARGANGNARRSEASRGPAPSSTHRSSALSR